MSASDCDCESCEVRHLSDAIVLSERVCPPSFLFNDKIVPLHDVEMTEDDHSHHTNILFCPDILFAGFTENARMFLACVLYFLQSPRSHLHLLPIDVVFRNTSTTSWRTRRIFQETTRRGPRRTTYEAMPSPPWAWPDHVYWERTLLDLGRALWRI